LHETTKKVRLVIVFVRVGAMTVVITASREQITRNRRDQHARDVPFGDQNGHHILNCFFENILWSHQDITTKVIFSVTFEGQSCGTVELFETDRRVPEQIENKS
jgi:hypothetical protein